MSDSEAFIRQIERNCAELERELLTMEAALVEKEVQREVLHREVVRDLAHEQIALDQLRATLQQIRLQSDALFARIEKILEGRQERLNRL